MPYRNKTYVCFDADNDMHYYRLMLAWKQNDNTDFNFYNAHDLNRLLPTSSEETIKRKLRERLLNSKTFMNLSKLGESSITLELELQLKGEVNDHAVTMALNELKSRVGSLKVEDIKGK